MTEVAKKLANVLPQIAEPEKPIWESTHARLGW